MALGSARTSRRQAGRTREETAAPRRTAPVSTTEDGRPTATGWLLRGKDGRLTAYAPTDEGVLRWTETRPAGPEWTGPELIVESAGLDPHLAIAQGADGYVHLFAIRRTEGDDGQVRTEIVMAVQYQSGRPVRDWHSLGTPYAQDWVHAAQIGRPTAVVDAKGNAHVFIRNAGGGVCVRSQIPSGLFSKWADLKGSAAQGLLAAGVAESGRIEILAPTAKSIMRWVQDDGDKPKFNREADIPSQVINGSVAAVRTGEDRLTFYWRDDKSGEVYAWRPDSAPEPLGGATGTGPVALLRAAVDGHDCTLMAHRDGDGRPALAAYPTENESVGAVWTGTGEVCVGAPALALDAHGRVVLAAFAPDGSLRITRQKTNEPGLAMEAWTSV
ncbi:hypothetical protein ACIHCQ_29085 [Streptomyces sp. NPDC052236]|uniref:hypothetical protein n=1 Tax=Streptomyces sp. NPDC052236 TaxID=3365686 RepID=UPI0037D8853E